MRIGSDIVGRVLLNRMSRHTRGQAIAPMANMIDPGVLSATRFATYWQFASSLDSSTNFVPQSSDIVACVDMEIEDD